MDSILNTIKKACNIAPDDTSFDDVIIMYINSTFLNLSQIGLNSATNFTITGDTETWSDLSPDVDLIAIQTYISLKVRMLFDPPASSSMASAIDKTISELEWRLNSRLDYEKEGEGT